MLYTTCGKVILSSKLSKTVMKILTKSISVLNKIEVVSD